MILKKRAIVYGLGKNYSNSGWLLKSYEVIALTDSKAEVRGKYTGLGIPVIDPKDIHKWDFDVVLVTPLSVFARETIRTVLISEGVRPEQIRHTTDTITLHDLIEAVETRSAVIYGCGYWAKIMFQILAVSGVEPVCFAEGELYPGDKNTVCGLGIPVLSLEAAVGKYPDAVFLIGFDGEARGAGGRFFAGKTEDLIRYKVYDYFSAFSPMKFKFVLSIPEYRLKSTTCSDGIEMDSLFCLDDFEEIIIQPIVIRGGSIMLSYLFSDHSNLISLPFYFFVLRSLTSVYLSKLRFMSGLPLAVAVLSECNLNNKHYLGSGNKWYDESGKEIFYTDVINQDLFVKYFCEYILRAKNTPNFGYIFKALHAAYANSLGKRPSEALKLKIYYHSHSWLFDEVWLSEFFNKVSIVATAREPVRASYSQWQYTWQSMMCGDITNYHDNALTEMVWSLPALPGLFYDGKHYGYFKIGDVTEVVKTDFTLDSSLFEIVEYASERISHFLKGANIVFIRFEDIKADLKKTMQKACAMLQLPFEEIVLRQTQGGVEVFNKGCENSSFVSFKDPTQLVSAKSKDAIKPISYERHFNSYDLFRIEMIYKGFSELFNYKREGGIPGISDFDNETLLKLLALPIKSLNEISNLNECELKNVTLFFMLFCYLQAKITETVIQCEGKNFLVEIETSTGEA